MGKLAHGNFGLEDCIIIYMGGYIIRVVANICKYFNPAPVGYPNIII